MLAENLVKLYVDIKVRGLSEIDVCSNNVYYQNITKELSTLQTKRFTNVCQLIVEGETIKVCKHQDKFYAVNGAESKELDIFFKTLFTYLNRTANLRVSKFKLVNKINSWLIYHICPTKKLAKKLGVSV